MATLVRFDAEGRWGDTLTGEAPVRAALAAHGLDHGRWPLRDVGNLGDLGDGNLDAVLAAYAAELAAWRERQPHLRIRSVDRVSLRPDHAGWRELRRQFLAEHTHADAEIRFFLGGAGLFYVRSASGHLGLLCEAGDWVAIPAGTRHFFDAGERPDFDALRLFTTPDGWQAQPTGAPTAALPLLDEFRARLRTAQGG